MKGISPLVATVLLIAFTVSIAGIISAWLTSFARTTTSTVSEESERQLLCLHASLSLRSATYSSSSNSLIGVLENSGEVPIGNISLQIIYNDATSQKFELCLVGDRVLNCSVSNLTLARYGDTATFNVSVSSYDKIDRVIVIGNCSTRDEIRANEITLS
jgi:flagellin-like protein